MSAQRGNTGSNHHKFAENTMLLRLLGQRMSDPDSFAGSERSITDSIRDYARSLNDKMTAAGNAAMSAPTTPIERAALN